ncbi:MAG TPA: hypothetical protein VGO07_05745 [Candidatus Saccharimonadales bacterium]|jgi:hypothetical protein|nr:hypothetical protein [Candidatus Saccharimonadales bacterium]
MTKHNSQERLGQYRTVGGKPFYVAEVVSGGRDEQSEQGLRACANGIADVLDYSWETKFVVPGVLSHADLAVAGLTGEQVKERITAGSRRYLVAVAGINPVTSPDDILAFTAFEDYQPRRPIRANPLLRKYPNIRDLESRDGMMTTESTVPRLALLHHVVEQANPKHKVSAYAEEASPASVRFYEEYGFTRDDSIPPAALTETFGQSRLTYVHMEAAAAGPVQELVLNGLFRYIDDV